jgi:RNA polymerase sigma-70 factor (ECF subfamily)
MVLDGDALMSLPGSRRRIQELVQQHYEGLYRYAYRLSGSAADAEDLTQDAFCQAQLKLNQLRDPARVKAWLYSILRNNYLHRLRDARREPTLPLDSIGDVAQPPPEPLPAVDGQRLQQALNELPEDFRTPVILYYFDDFSYRDIAEQMELPIGTVMSRLARAKAHLRARLLQARAALALDPGRANDGL